MSELSAAVAGYQWVAPDIAHTAFGLSAGVWKQRHLMGGCEQEFWLFPEDRLGTIAVVHVKIQDRDPL